MAYSKEPTQLRLRLIGEEEKGDKRLMRSTLISNLKAEAEPEACGTIAEAVESLLAYSVTARKLVQEWNLKKDN